MKLVLRSVLLLLVGLSLADRGQAAWGFFPGYPKRSPYAPIPSAPPPAAAPQVLTPVAAPAVIPEAVSGAQTSEPPAQASEAPAQQTATTEGEIQVTADRVVGQYESGSGTIVYGAEAGTCKINSKHLHFNYDLRDVGPSGVQAVEVWLTRDGKNWQKYDRGILPAGGTIDVDEEGVYGVSFVPRTGFGGGKEAPAEGDAPNLWVEVDVTKPMVSLVGMQPSAGSRTLRIDWSATDKNLGRQPIVLSYAEQKDGPWIHFTGKLENTGSYTWQVPPSTPSSFWMRVEAIDQAGNVGTSESQSPVKIDLAQPNVTNVRVSGR